MTSVHSYYIPDFEEKPMLLFHDRNTGKEFSCLADYLETETFELALISSGLDKEEYLKMYVK